MDYLVQLKDGGILDFQYDTESWAGCETCDYGSSYINEITVDMENSKVIAKISQMYDFVLSEGYLMRLIPKNIDAIREKTEKGFSEWFKAELDKQIKEEVADYALRDVEFEYEYLLKPNDE